MKKFYSVTNRLLGIIFVLGLLFFAVVTLLSNALIVPAFRQIDIGAGVREVNRILELMRLEIQDDISATRQLNSTELQISPSDRKWVENFMNVNSIDFISIPGPEGHHGWLRQSSGIVQAPDPLNLVSSRLRGPFLGVRTPWAFVCLENDTEVYILTADIDHPNPAITGRRLTLDSQFIRSGDTDIAFLPASADHGLPVITSIGDAVDLRFGPVEPASVDYRFTDQQLVIRLVLNAPYLEHGLIMTFVRDAYASNMWAQLSLRRHIVLPFTLFVLMAVTGLWIYLRIARPIRQLTGFVEEWDGFTMPDTGSLTSRRDEVGTLSRVFVSMGTEIREKTQSLENQASRDGLTGLLNRRRFDEALQREWDRHIRSENTLGLIMADIDFFKKYNDTYGHQEGDECLRTVARVCEQCLHRPGDQAFRYGGEEFVMILPDTDLPGLKAVAQHIRQTIEDLRIPNKASPLNGFLSVSMGAAVSGPDGQIAYNDLLRIADEALYQAKNEGRNRLVTQSDTGVKSH